MPSLIGIVMGVVSPKITAAIKTSVVTACGGLITSGYLTGDQAQLFSGLLASLVMLVLNVLANRVDVLSAKVARTPGYKVVTDNPAAKEAIAVISQTAAAYTRVSSDARSPEGNGNVS